MWFRFLDAAGAYHFLAVELLVPVQPLGDLAPNPLGGRLDVMRAIGLGKSSPLAVCVARDCLLGETASFHISVRLTRAAGRHEVNS
jgi:hypothetical protein